MRPEAVFFLAALVAVAATPGALAQAPAAPAVPAVPPPGPAPDAWIARPVVDLMALDKVSARATPLSGKVGQPLQFGSLTVVARACVVRPPDAAADAAAFLDITDARPGTEPFHAWMLVTEPAVTIYEHPVYDIRLVGCRAG
jgi:hypothetical protein